MSGDETFVGLVAVAIALSGWWRWYARLARHPRMGAGGRFAIPLALTPLVILGAVYLVLRLLASVDVRESGLYLAFYVVLGAAWLVVDRLAATWMGLSWIDDAQDRRNPAAMLAIIGALAGGASCYAGGNVGDGPGWWCVALAGGLATLVWLALWMTVERVTAVSEAVTVERDLGAGLRLGAWLLSCGLVAGRGAAGDWFDLGSTIVDLVRTSWPILPLAALALLVELRRARRHPSRTDAWLAASAGLAVVYLGVAVAVLLLSPAPMENPIYHEIPREIG